MNRHLKNKKFAKQRQQKRLIWAGSTVGLIFLISFVIYLNYPMASSKSVLFFSHYYSQIQTWMSERRHHLDKKVIKAKQVATKQNDEPVIHFEFYTALPNMQVNGSHALTDNGPPVPSSKTNLGVTSADELERELSHELKRVK